MAKKNPQIHSYYLAGGPQIHRDSGFLAAGLGTYPHEVHEIALSSHWVFQRLREGEALFRCAVTFPGEWKSLQEAKACRSDSIAFDFWIFGELSSNEKEELKSLLGQSKHNRLVVGANHLMNWNNLILSFANFEKQIALSFLPPANEMAPFLNPQEVLDELEIIPATLPILVPHFSEKKGSPFYQTLNKETYILEMQLQRSGFIRAIRLLDKSGFHLILLAIESLLAYFLEGRTQRIYTFFKHLRDFFGHTYRTTRNLLVKLIWYWGLTKLFHILRLYIYGFLRYTLWGFMKNHGWIFIRYRLPAFFLILLYPIRKIYWFSSYQFQKRILIKVKKDEA